MNDPVARELKELGEQLPDPAVLARGMDEIPASIVMIDENGLIYFVNRQTEQLFGYLREEILGKPIHIFVPNLLQEKHSEHLSKFIRNPRSRSMGVGLSLKGQKKNGITFSVEINLGPFMTRKGLFVVATIVAVDDK